MVNGTNSEALTELRGISKYYGLGENRIAALQNINLCIYPSEFVAILGPSGCGKSTLVRITTGLAAPSEGEVLYRGKPLLEVNPHATIVFQTFALYPWLTVLGNVEVALKARGIHSSERKKRALAAIDMVGLDGFEEAYPRELSGGMRQKVGFARAIAVQPELLCLDEPFSSLDILS
ncbi:MAG: ATP-binding cassette domain-containing protein, partial [Candidatus Tectomicrobia bacterium]|nr:ATP-binding cassette domain-containing protein [Candidatus Tectomicrobia bacterium]